MITAEIIQEGEQLVEQTRKDLKELDRYLRQMMAEYIKHGRVLSEKERHDQQNDQD